MPRLIDYLTPQRLNRAYYKIIKKYQSKNNKGITSDDWNEITKLIQNGVDPNNKWIIDNTVGAVYEKCTILHSAIIHKNYVAIELLLQNGADINAPTGHYKYTPLHLAIFTRDDTIVDLILDHAHTNPNNALDLNTTDLYGNSILHDICANPSQLNNPEVFILKCFELGANVNIQNRIKETPLHKICDSYKDIGTIVRLLLDNKANTDLTDYNNNIPLHLALKYPENNAAKILLNYQDVNVPADTLLYALAQNISDATLIQLIIDKNKDTLNNQDEEGNTALHLAINNLRYNTHYNILDTLIKCGINPYVENNSKNTALDYAIMNSNIKLVNYILDTSNFDINFIYSDGRTLLQKCTEQNYSYIIPILVEKGAALDIRGKITPYWIHGFSNLNKVDTVELVKMSELSKIKSVVDISAYKSNSYECSPINIDEATIIFQKIIQNVLSNSTSIAFSKNPTIIVTIENKEYQLSDIIENTNFAHLTFSKDEINAYANNPAISFVSCFNDKINNGFKHKAVQQKPSFELFVERIYTIGPKNLLDLEYGEMLAIHQYSVQGNPLLWLIRDQYDGPVDKIPQYLMTIAIASHGLYRLPDSDIPCVIRQQDYYNFKMLIDNAKHFKVTQTQEFISTSYYSDHFAPSWRLPVQVIIYNARGKDIKAISGYSYEDEYLLPPSTQLEWTGYQITPRGYIFTAEGRHVLLGQEHTISNVNQWDSAIRKLVLDFSDNKYDHSKDNMLKFLHTILNISVYHDIISCETKNEWLIDKKCDAKCLLLDEIMLISDNGGNYNDIAAYILYKINYNCFPIEHTDLHNINYKQELLYHSILAKDVNTAITLLQNDLDCNIALPCSTTLLHLAVQHNLHEVVTALINHGANLNIRDNAGNTPLIDAILAEELSEKTIKLLIDGPDINLDIKNNDALSALHFAAKYNHLNIVKLLLDAGANINAVNDEGDTALHLALQYHYVDIAKLLFSNSDVDIHVQNDLSLTPLQLAMSIAANDQELEKLIHSKVAITGYQLDVSNNKVWSNLEVEINDFNNSTNDQNLTVYGQDNIIYDII